MHKIDYKFQTGLTRLTDSVQLVDDSHCLLEQYLLTKAIDGINFYSFQLLLRKIYLINNLETVFSFEIK